MQVRNPFRRPEKRWCLKWCSKHQLPYVLTCLFYSLYTSNFPCKRGRRLSLFSSSFIAHRILSVTDFLRCVYFPYSSMTASLRFACVRRRKQRKGGEQTMVVTYKIT